MNVASSLPLTLPLAAVALAAAVLLLLLLRKGAKKGFEEPPKRAGANAEARAVRSKGLEVLPRGKSVC